MSHFQLTFSLHFCLLALAFLSLIYLQYFFCSLFQLYLNTFFFLLFIYTAGKKTLPPSLPTKTKKARKWEYCMETTDEQGVAVRNLCQDHISSLEKGGRHVHIGKNHCQGLTVPGNGMEKAPRGIANANSCWKKGLRTDKCKKIKAFCDQVAPCVQRAAQPEAREAAVQARGFVWMLHTHQDQASCTQALPQLENLPIWEQLQSQSRKWMCLDQLWELQLEELETNSLANTKDFPQQFHTQKKEQGPDLN